MSAFTFNGERVVLIPASGLDYLTDTIVSGASFFNMVTESKDFRHGIRFALIQLGLITQEDNDELTLAISDWGDDNE